MQEVVLVIHLILALVIIGLVLLQRSSGGGFVSGGGMGDFATARGAANALTKATTICAFLFFATSLSLAVIAKHKNEQGGLLSGVSAPAPVSETGAPLPTPPLPNDAAAPAPVSAPAPVQPAEPVKPKE